VHDLDRDPLRLSADEMRRVGYRTIDLLVERLLADGPVVARAAPDELAQRVGGPPPEEPEGFDLALEALARDVLPFAMRNDHPGFLGFIPTGGTWPGALADLVGSALAIDASSWAEAAGPSAVEAQVIRWFADWIGYPAQAQGLLVSGGSAANLTAIACARETLVGAMRPDLVGYVTDQAHSSLPRAARALGFRPDQLRVLPTDGAFRLEPAVLHAAIHADRSRGLRPLVVVASAGATNTGAVDPLTEIAAVCRAHGAWLHVDAAYGGFAVLTERGRALLSGLELADSVTIDPHKWLYQPWECGALLVREGDRLRRAFTIVPDYLRETQPKNGEVNFGDMGLQLSRAPRALKVWLSIRTFGLAAFRAAIDRSLDLADRLRDRIALHDALEVAAPPSLSITCVRRRFPEAGSPEVEDALNRALALEVERAGLGLVTTTTLAGRTAIRLCVLNHATGPDDVDAIVDLLATADVAATAAEAALGEQNSDALAWAGPAPGRTAGVPPALLGGLAVLADTSDEALRRIASIAEERTHAQGAVVVTRFEPGGDFFLIVEGEVEVEIDGTVVATLVAGDFFGELGALDWGAGYGYARMATVTARTPLRVVVLPDRSLAFAMRLSTPLDRAVRRAFHERLPRR
jgi:glutamate/tyrosine decarboxylase-like PLP-dependent enzyme